MPAVKCVYCKNHFFKSVGRFNEARKFKWNFYCSRICQGNYLRRTSFFICENTKCNKKFEKLRKEIGPYNYCSRSCAAIVNNQKFPKWIEKIKSCRICKNRFRGQNVYCSTPCYKKSRMRHKPEDLIKQIKIAYEKLGRVPAKREIFKLARASEYTFGSWTNAVVAAGLIPNRSHDHRMYKRTRTKAKDGHVCDSISEAIIDNWLVDNKIAHERDFPYPGSNHKADWAINKKTFIEYFGLAKDSPRYYRDIKTKQRLCKKLGIKLIGIYPRDLYPKLNLDLKLAVFV